jgi:hypothetical protein
MPPPPDAFMPPPPDAFMPPPPDAFMPPPPDAAPPPPDMGVMPPDAVMMMIDSAATGAQLQITPLMFDYGNVVVGSASPGVDFTVTNTGDTTSGVPAPFVPTGFTIESTSCSAPLAAQAICVVRVQMMPSQSGPSSGSLVVTASPGGPVMAALMGYGADPARLDVTPNMQAFGNAAPGQTGASYTFTVRNVGGVQAGLPNVAVNPATGAFVISQNLCTAALDPTGSCQVTLTFIAPAVIGQATGQLDISASPGGNSSVPLMGNSSYIEVTPTSANFGDVTTLSLTMGGTGFTVWHLGPAGSPMVSVMDMLGGSNPSDFMITSDTCVNGLSSGGNCTITLQFMPVGTPGPRSAELDISAIDRTAGAPAGTDKALLTGNGV